MNLSTGGIEILQHNLLFDSWSKVKANSFMDKIKILIIMNYF